MSSSYLIRYRISFKVAPFASICGAGIRSPALALRLLKTSNEAVLTIGSNCQGYYFYSRILIHVPPKALSFGQRLNML